MEDIMAAAADYGRVEKIIRFLQTRYLDQPSLAEIARGAGLSEFHVQKLFSRWAGISPKRFIQYLTKEHAKKLLQGSHDVLDAAYGAGLSGPGRLHDLLVSCDAVTPGEYGHRGEGLSISYGFHPSPFGECLVAVTGRGICALRFVMDDGRAALVQELRRQWPKAGISRDDGASAPYARAAFARPADGEPVPLHLYVQGTNFQIKVWEALLRIPMGSVVSYEDIAAHIGSPGASRAVGGAVGANPVLFLIPCHRVIRASGEFGGYAQGVERKKAILGWESAAQERISTAVN